MSDYIASTSNTINSHIIEDETIIFINALTQSGKTRYFINLIDSNIDKENTNLVIVITQSNNISVRDQTIKRIKKSNIINTIPDEKILISKEFINVKKSDKSYCVVDFFHSRNIQNILSTLPRLDNMWDNIILVIDEIDQGNLKGRLDFIESFNNIVGNNFKLIIVTATGAKLCTTFPDEDTQNADYRNGGTVYNMMHRSVCSLHTISIGSNYTGLDYFLDNPSSYECIIGNLSDKIRNSIPSQKKKLTLVVNSIYQKDHDNIIRDLIETDVYTMGIALDGSASSTKRNIYYKKTDNTIATFIINEADIFKSIKNSRLRYYDPIDDRWFLIREEDVSVQHIYQAIIQKESETYYSLISGKDKNIINSLRTYLAITNKIPIDEFPQERNIIVAAGLYASRGITIQSKEAMFIFSSFVFLSTLKSEDKGADDYQKIGRMTGYYKEEYNVIKPVLLASNKILSSARANANLVEEKRNISYVHTGEFQKLSEIISQSDWDNSLSSCKNYIKNASKSARIEVPAPEPENEENILNVDNSQTKDAILNKIAGLIIKWRKSLRQENKSTISQIYYAVFKSEDGITEDEFKNILINISGEYNSLWRRSILEKDYSEIFILKNNKITFTDICREVLIEM